MLLEFIIVIILTVLIWYFSRDSQEEKISKSRKISKNTLDYDKQHKDTYVKLNVSKQNYDGRERRNAHKSSTSQRHLLSLLYSLNIYGFIKQLFITENIIINQHFTNLPNYEFSIKGKNKNKYSLEMLDYNISLFENRINRCKYRINHKELEKSYTIIGTSIENIYNKLRKSLENMESEWQKSLINLAMDKIDGMDGESFEKILAKVFRKKGYIVKDTPMTKDYGVDLIVKGDLVTFAIQAKCYNNKVSINSVQEVNTGLDYYDCDKGIVITNSYFTKSAKQLAQKTNIDLWNREKLSNFIAEYTDLNNNE